MIVDLTVLELIVAALDLAGLPMGDLAAGAKTWTFEGGYVSFGVDGQGFVFSPSGNAIALLVCGLYFVALDSSRWQATFGKMAVGLRITDIEAGGSVLRVRRCGSSPASSRCALWLGISWQPSMDDGVLYTMWLLARSY